MVGSSEIQFLNMISVLLIIVNDSVLINYNIENDNKFSYSP